MYEVCAECGDHIADAEIDPHGPDIICSECGFRQRFRRLPLFIVTGASGTGIPPSSRCEDCPLPADGLPGHALPRGDGGIWHAPDTTMRRFHQQQTGDAWPI